MPEEKTHRFVFVTKAKNGRRVTHERTVTQTQATDPIQRAAVISYAQACHGNTIVNWRFES